MKSTSVIKIDPTGLATERAIQVLPGPPGSPVDTQIWYDKTNSQLAIQANGQINPLNVRVLGSDPGSPQDGECWVNATTNQFKYKYLGGVHAISFTGSGSVQQPLGQYYQILSQDELSQLSDLGLLYPNFLIDAFNVNQDEATYTNASPQ